MGARQIGRTLTGVVVAIERAPEGAMRTDAEVAQAWDQNSDLWVRHVRAGWDRLRETFNNPMFFAFTPDLAGREISDRGCGEGRNTREGSGSWSHRQSGGLIVTNLISA